MVERGGQNAVLDRLKKELYIPKSHARTQGNTRLALRSKPVEMLQMVIDEQLNGNKYHDLMYSLYVSNLSKAEVMVKYRMTELELEETLKEAEGPPPYLEDISLENYGLPLTAIEFCYIYVKGTCLLGIGAVINGETVKVEYKWFGASMQDLSLAFTKDETRVELVNTLKEQIEQAVM